MSYDAPASGSLGVFLIDTKTTYNFRRFSDELSGYSAGLNAGAFVPVGPTSLVGVLLTLDVRDMRRLCSTYPDGSDESCGPDNDTVDAVGLLGVSAALLF